jgi:putative transposase
MHRNPVKHGLAANPEDWPWSSFPHYATGKEGIVEVESEWTARKREMQKQAPSELLAIPPFAKSAKDGAPVR